MATHSTPVYAQLFGAETAAYDLNQFHWIGALTNSQRVMGARSSLQAPDFENALALRRLLILPVSNAMSPSDIEAKLIGAMTRLSLRVLVGVNESLRTTLLLSGEADLVINSFYSLRPYVDSGELVPLLRLGSTGYPAELNRLPSLGDVVREGTPAELVDLMDSLNALGRLILAAPRTSPEEVDALRHAFDLVVLMPTLSETYDRQGQILAPTTGAEVERRMSMLLGNALTRDLLAVYLDCAERESKDGDIDCLAR